MKNKLVQIGEHDGWKLYINSDGFVEAYKKTGKRIVNKEDIGTDSKRLVTNQTTVEGFIKYLNGLKPKRAIKDIPLKPSQLPQLFTDAT